MLCPDTVILPYRTSISCGKHISHDKLIIDYFNSGLVDKWIAGENSGLVDEWIAGLMEKRKMLSRNQGLT